MFVKKNSSFFQNLVWAIILIFALLVIVQVALGFITRHGQEIVVPDFYSLSQEDARKMASKSRLRFEVTDSVYVDNLERGAVFSQNPLPGEKVKKGRRILITINAVQEKTISMPALVGLSLRGARTEIYSRGFKLGSLEYVSDMATNYVLEQRVGRRMVDPGDLLPLGTIINLVVGVNPEENYTFIPQLTGYDLEMASSELVDNSLNLYDIKYDKSVVDESDKHSALVYSQSPAASSSGSFPRGTRVTLYMTVDSVKCARALAIKNAPAHPSDSTSVN